MSNTQNNIYEIVLISSIILHPTFITLLLFFAQSFRRNSIVRHTKREKKLFILKVEYMSDEKFVVQFEKQQEKERGKLIRNSLKKNKSKLIETGWIGVLAYKPPNPTYLLWSKRSISTSNISSFTFKIPTVDSTIQYILKSSKTISTIFLIYFYTLQFKISWVWRLAPTSVGVYNKCL